MIKNTLLPFICVLLVSCGGGGGSSSDSQPIDTNNNIFVYKNQNASQSNALLECLDTRPDNFISCDLSKLTLIGMDTSEPTVAQIMSRVVVTHDWMGKRFEELLNIWPEEMRLLFRGTTGIVIARTIRPSFFTIRSGAIYLDPKHLWLTNEEKETIENKSDPRSDNDSLLNFKLRQYLVNSPGGGSAFYSPSLDSEDERILTDIEVIITAVVAHELAHANDYFSQDRIASLLISQTVEDASSPTTTEGLYENYPLLNQTLLDLGQVLYHGEEASIDQQNITAEEYGNLFDSEAAVLPYAYSTPREDMATLFEVSMIKYLYDVDVAVASMNMPYDFDDMPIYGNFNRLGEAAVKQRAEFVAERILPEVDWDTFFQDIDPKTNMNLFESLRVNIWGEP